MQKAIIKKQYQEDEKRKGLLVLLCAGILVLSLAGCDEAGYLGVPAEWNEHKITAEVIRDTFIEQYANMGAINLRTDEITINGVHFYQTVDYIPAGGIVDYYLYTYVAYTDRFYSFVIEGDEAVIEESVEKAEKAFTITETDGYDEDNSNHSFVQ